MKHVIIHFCRHPASLKVLISKVQDFGNFELTPWQRCMPRVNSQTQTLPLSTYITFLLFM